MKTLIGLGKKFFSFFILFSIQSITVSANDYSSDHTPQALYNFMSARQRASDQINEYESSNNILTPSDYEKILESIRSLKNEYLLINRKTLDPEWLYNAQFQIRFLNQKLHVLLQQKLTLKQISVEQKQSIEYEAQILNSANQKLYKSPQKSIPIFGVKGSDWSLSKWINDKEFYNYMYEDDEVVYRGLRLRSGDIILNHPIEKPVGIFTAISDTRSVYSHGAMIIFYKSKWGRLPIVVDVHERGIRAVPLHHYLGSKVIGYGEIYRYESPPENFEQKLDKAVKVLMSKPHPYDLTGSEDRRALSCVEMISFLLELIGEPKIELKHKISDNIYKNILRFGKLNYQKFQMPNDVFEDERFKYIGYVDNTLSLENLIANEVLLDLFREKMENKIVKRGKDLERTFGEIAIREMRNKYSFLGYFLLQATGFDRSNFPAGDPGLLTAVNSIDTIFANVMNRCLNLNKNGKQSSCYKSLNNFIKNRIHTLNNYSIHDIKSDVYIRVTMDIQLSSFDQLFIN